MIHGKDWEPITANRFFAAMVEDLRHLSANGLVRERRAHLENQTLSEEGAKRG